MYSYFNQPAYNDLIQRLDNLKPNANALWGKMNAAQMLAHCQFPIQIALAKETVPLKPNWLIKFFFKKLLYSNTPYSKNAPTAPVLIVKESKDFHTEKAALKQWMQELWNDRANENRRDHPVFGTFTKDQWGAMQWKHLDHHFRQFDV